MAGTVDRLLICPNCRMTFTSPSLLYRHQEKFCVGGFTENPRKLEPSYRSSNGARTSYDHRPVYAPSPRRAATSDTDAQKSSQILRDLREENRKLQEQKAAIDRRLLQLNNEEDRSLLDDMVYQQRRNRKQLEKLREQTRNLRMGRPATADKSILAEIISARQNYLRQGGRNMAILSQMADLEREAHLLEQSNTYAKKMRKTHVADLQERIAAFEMENDRLRYDLNAIQERYDKLMREVRTDDNVKELDALTKHAKAKQQEYLKQLTDLENEMEITRHQARLERLRRELQDVSMAAAPPPQAPAAESPPQPPAPMLPSLAYQLPHTVQNPPKPQFTSDVPYLLNNQMSTDHDPLYPSSYDQQAGFIIFYDYVTGLDSNSEAVSIISCLYSDDSKFGPATTLPYANCQPMSQHFATSPGMNMAHMAVKQPVPGCPARLDMFLVVEVQVASQAGLYNPERRFTSRAWAKLQLFDRHKRLITGRYRIPLRVLPLQAQRSLTDITGIPQYGQSELYLRIVNMRDSEAQSAIDLSMPHLQNYKLPSQVLGEPKPDVTPVQRGMDKPKVVAKPVVQGSSAIIGFQVDRIKHGGSGEGKVRLTAYNKDTGKTINTVKTPMTCSTSSVLPYFKHRYHVFGQQEATFNDVPIEGNIILIARFYLYREVAEVLGPNDVPRVTTSKTDKETLAAWTAMPLVSKEHGQFRVNAGTHFLPLFVPPVTDVQQVPDVSRGRYPDSWKKYRQKAMLRLHVFEGTPRPGEASESEDSETEEERVLPLNAWIRRARSAAPTTAFTQNDAFYLYIDGARFLPDNTSVSKVAGRLLDSSYTNYGDDIQTSIQLDSIVNKPVYKSRNVFAVDELPQTATFIFKIYSIDGLTDELAVIGYATLNVFVIAGTTTQPKPGDEETQAVCLNEGAHQLRLYEHGPSGDVPFCEGVLRDEKRRFVPCASLLVRLYPAAKDNNGTLLSLDKVDKKDWVGLGLYHPLPKYEDRVYLSQSCYPTDGEILLFHAAVKHKEVKVRDAVKLIADEEEMKKITTDEDTLEYISDILTRDPDHLPPDADITYAFTYSQRHGFTVAVDCAQNLPWKNFTFACVCPNPPGAFYKGLDHAAIDRLKCTKSLDPQSTSRHPRWTDGYFHFPSRTYSPYLTLIIHLQELKVTKAKETNRYELVGQAWTALNIFVSSLSYVAMGTYQLPLFRGAPTPDLVEALKIGSSAQIFVDGVKSRKLKTVDGASVFVRLTDGRRSQEISDPAYKQPQEDINTNFIPASKRPDYAQEGEGQKLVTLVPEGKDTDEFFQNLSARFESLVYKLANVRNIPDK